MVARGHTPWYYGTADRHFNEGQKFPITVYIRWRYVVAFLGFFGMINSYTLRGHLSVTLVAMVNSTDDSTNKTLECPVDSDNSTTSERTGDFDWDEQLQGIINGGFYWGYMVPQILAGRLAELYGGKKVIFVGGLIGAFATLIGPWAASVHVGFFIATRIVCGLGLGVFTPSLHAIIARWCPPKERSRLSSVVYSGNQFGTIIAMPIAGLLCQYAPNNGWPWPFYVFGMLCCVWLTLWLFLMYDSPSDHPWISEEEKNFISRSLCNAVDHKLKKPPVPWKAIFTSVAFWSLLWAHFGQNWGFYTLLTQIPSYMSNVLGFDIGENGLLSSVPYIAMMLVGYISSFIADILIKRKILKVGTARRTFNSIALYGSGISLLIITFLRCQTMAIYALLVLAVGFDGAMYAGFQINHVDLSPNFAGTLQGLTNTVGCIPGIVSPYITGVVTAGGQTRENWSIIFYITFGMLFFFATQYLLFAKGTLQPWNEPKMNENEIELSKNSGDLPRSTNLGPVVAMQTS